MLASDVEGRLRPGSTEKFNMHELFNKLKYDQSNRNKKLDFRD